MNSKEYAKYYGNLYYNHYQNNLNINLDCTKRENIIHNIGEYNSYNVKISSKILGLTKRISQSNFIIENPQNNAEYEYILSLIKNEEPYTRIYLLSFISSVPFEINKNYLIHNKINRENYTFNNNDNTNSYLAELLTTEKLILEDYIQYINNNNKLGDIYKFDFINYIQHKNRIKRLYGIIDELKLNAPDNIKLKYHKELIQNCKKIIEDLEYRNSINLKEKIKSLEQGNEFYKTSLAILEYENITLNNKLNEVQDELTDVKYMLNVLCFKCKLTFDDEMKYML